MYIKTQKKGGDQPKSTWSTMFCVASVHIYMSNRIVIARETYSFCCLFNGVTEATRSIAVVTVNCSKRRPVSLSFIETRSSSLLAGLSSACASKSRKYSTKWQACEKQRSERQLPLQRQSLLKILCSFAYLCMSCHNYKTVC